MVEDIERYAAIISIIIIIIIIITIVIIGVVSVIIVSLGIETSLVGKARRKYQSDYRENEWMSVSFHMRRC